MAPEGSDTDLEAWLRERAIDTITPVGYMTNNCVIPSAAAAEALGFAVELRTGAPLRVMPARFEHLARGGAVGREPEYGGVGHDVLDKPVGHCLLQVEQASGVGGPVLER
ncbi:isochorismatase family protein [Pseudarthrobacter sulfonivorans]|uniref:isochorismatase family protein n=1 Tax=Pseudarthrobacter sulfonivorans TaxID=121292 RepID=UPI0028635D6A|nr:isochorismatase family protein [Pseudarthrobacter sulfonivorans]MDR6415555.1 hypothetical protein [Pseudarthrobacter sulfonivorans]